MSSENDDQNEFQKLVSYVNEALDKEGDRDPLLKIDRVIQLIKDFYKKDEDMGNTYESKEKENKSLIFSALCKKETKDGKLIKITTNSDRDSAAVEIKLIIERFKKKTNSKKEKKDQKPQSTSNVMNSVEETEPPENDQKLMKNFNTNVGLVKSVFNYLQPLIMCHESIKETIKNENKKISAREPYTPIQKLYFIVITTRNCLCHSQCFFDRTLIRKMYINIKNFYHILGVNLNDKKLREKLYSDNPINANLYYYAPGGVKYPNDSKQIIEVSRDTINSTIKSLIMRGHSEGEVINSNSQSIILFGKLLHLLVGTRDTNWNNITGYFEGYEIEPLKDGGENEASSAHQAPDQKEEIKNNLNITLKIEKRKNKKDFFFEATKLIIHWAQMPLRYKDEGADGINIDEIRSALAAESTTQLGYLFPEIISEKKEQLEDIIKLFESTDKSGSAHKIDREYIDVFFKQLIDSKQIAYISSADATTLSDNSQMTQAELEQRNERLTADSNRLIICPLKVQNQWFLFVADRKNNRCSLYDSGNDSVRAPHVQNLCKTLLSNLQKLASLIDIPKGKRTNQPQNIDEDCGSFICSLAFNLVYCPLHLYPKDVRRIIMAKIL